MICNVYIYVIINLLNIIIIQYNNACFNFQNRFDIFKSIKLENEI